MSSLTAAGARAATSELPAWYSNRSLPVGDTIRYTRGRDSFVFIPPHSRDAATAAATGNRPPSPPPAHHRTHARPPSHLRAAQTPSPQAPAPGTVSCRKRTQVFLCLSRACHGKTIVFIGSIKWRKKGVFRTRLRNHSPAAEIHLTQLQIHDRSTTMAVLLR